MAAAAVTNGYRPSDGDAELSAFYREMLQLRADVLAGKHPRIKLPESVVAQLRSPSPARISQPPNANAQPFLSNGHANGLGAAARGSANDDGLEYEPAPRSAATSAFNAPPPNESAAPSRPAARHISSSGFDPILLQKAPIVIQEELRQKRQRIERSLKDAYDQRRQSSARSKDTDAESASLLALSEILQKALRLVKPISGLKSAANKRKASSSSFDTNSYYSSQVNDWSSEQSSNGRESEAAAVDATGPSAQTASIKARQSQTDTASNVPLTKNPASELEGLQRQAYTTLQPDGRSVHDKGPHFYTNEPDEVYEAEKEESDYSPPAADAFVTDADGEAMDTDDGMFPSPTSSGTVFEFPPDDEEYEPQSFVTVPDEPPSPDVPVIRNHLTQIAAPQPARVSPLTVAKVPRLNQSQASSHQSNKGASHVQVPQFGAAGAIAEASSASASPRNSGRQSPMSGRTRAKRPARKPRQSRKRKREVEAAAVISGPSKKARDVRARPQSPEMYIKDEPVSPPPFSAVPASQTVTRRPTYHSNPEVDIASPREALRTQQQRAYSQQQYHPPTQPVRYVYEQVGSPAVTRISSPATTIVRPRRDDQDLRRVASMHAAQRPYSPVAYSPAGPYRTSSQQFVERQVAQEPAYAEDDQIIRGPPAQYARSERASPPRLVEARDPYVQRVHTPGTMAPPSMPAPRRVVMDQYGNKYYAAEPEPQPLARTSVAPQPRPREEIAYERAPSRMPTAYITRPAYDVYDDDARAGMPPPPPVRRVTIQPEPQPQEHRVYREYSLRLPEPQYYREEPAPVYIRDPAAPPHRMVSVQPYDAAHPAPHVTRAYSVRPEMESAPVYVRQSSIAPVDYVRRSELPPPPPPPPVEYVRRSEMPPPPPIRAVSVVHGAEYATHPHEAAVRYSYAPVERAQSVRYVEEGNGGNVHGAGMEQPLDPYGREVRRYEY